MQSKVTVVTITYNLISAQREGKLKRCIESIQKQTYKNIEHIVIDGASTDGTIELLGKYQNLGLIKYFSEPDTGIYNAFNNGIKRATGDYIVFLNSDDYYHSALGVEKSVEALLKSGADFSYADDMVFDEKKDKARVRKANLHSIFQRMPFCHQTMFTKKEVFSRLGNFDENYKSAGDYEFIIRIFMQGARGVKTEHNFCTFCLGGESTTNERKSQKECIKIYQKLYAPFYKLSYREAYVMQHWVITPYKLLPYLADFFKGYDKFLFYYFYVKSVTIWYRRWIFQYRNSKDERKFRILGKNIIKHINYEYEEHIKPVRERLAKKVEINSELQEKQP